MDFDLKTIVVILTIAVAMVGGSCAQSLAGILKVLVQIQKDYYPIKKPFIGG